MSKVNILIEKALSTSSEEEAVSCLRMARKLSKGSPSANTHPPAYDQQKLLDMIRGLSLEVDRWKKISVFYSDRYTDKSKAADSLKDRVARLEGWNLALILVSGAMGALFLGVVAF